MKDRHELIQVIRVPENRRLTIPEALFGVHFPVIEQTIYLFADRLSFDYKGGYWDFYTLGNGGFYMAPDSDSPFYVQADNSFSEDMEPDAFGITCCLFAYSHLCFSSRPDLSELCTTHFHRLREAILEHPDGGRILAAAD